MIIKKRHVLCVCNTYYQLLITIQLKMTQFLEDDVTVILSDHSINSKSIVSRLQQEMIFSNVFFAETRAIDNISYNRFSKALISVKCIFGLDRRLNFIKSIPPVDIFMFYNDNYSTLILYSAVIRKNPQMACARFEEGLVSYEHEISEKPHSKSGKLMLRGLHLCGFQTLNERTNSFYCFLPKLYDGRLTPIAVQPMRVDDKQLVSLLKRIFSIQPENLCYTQKYIYFASPFDSDLGIDDEFNIVREVAEVLGKNNILIKKHPRDRRTVYEDNGYLVDQNSAIPWEVIQCCVDLSDKILLSTFSSSVLSSNVTIDGGVEMRFLYKLRESNVPVLNSSCLSIERIIEKIKCKGIGELKKIKVVHSLKEIV